MIGPALTPASAPDSQAVIWGGRPITTPTLYRLTKAAGDWLCALAMLILAAPVVGLLIVLIRLTSPGPALYAQTRLGRHGRPYTIYKLRTMAHRCEERTGAVWAAPDDPRTTRLGRFLRETHLDELPQLWNVLKGEMSLIGPRPERPEIASQLCHVFPQYTDRLTVLPGLTGLAQLQLPADTDLGAVHRKLSQDLYYVREMSLLMDLRIAVATAFHLVAGVFGATSKILVRSYGQAADREVIDHSPVPDSRGDDLLIGDRSEEPRHLPSPYSATCSVITGLAKREAALTIAHSHAA